MCLEPADNTFATVGAEMDNIVAGVLSAPEPHGRSLDIHVLPEKARADEKRQRLIQNCSWMCRPPMGALKPDLIVQLDRIQERGVRDVVTLEVAMECHPSAARHGLFDDALKHVSRRLNVILIAVQHNFSLHGALGPMDEEALKPSLDKSRIAALNIVAFALNSSRLSTLHFSGASSATIVPSFRKSTQKTQPTRSLYPSYVGQNTKRTTSEDAEVDHCPSAGYLCGAIDLLWWW